jgi:lysozyme
MNRRPDNLGDPAMSTARRRCAAACLMAALAVAQAHAQPEAPVTDKALDLASVLREVESAVALAGGIELVPSRASLRDGETVTFTATLPRGGYLNVVGITAGGEAVVLFPNPHQPDNRVEAGRFTLPGPQMPFEIRASAPFGEMRVAAFLSAERLDLQSLGAAATAAASGSGASRFAAFTLAARDLINQLANRRFKSDAGPPALAAGMTSVMTCAPTGPCDRPGSDGTVRRIVDAFVPGIFFDRDEDKPKALPADLRPLSQAGITLTKVSEGFVPRLYHDPAGHCTIAYGHLLKQGHCLPAQRSRYPQGISEPAGGTLLTQDLGLAQAGVQRLVTVPLSDSQFSALVDFTYNVGIGNLKRSTLLKAVNAGQHERVPFQLRRWTRAGGREIRGLVIRREREIALYFDGQTVPKQVPKDEVTTPLDIRAGEGS